LQTQWKTFSAEAWKKAPIILSDYGWEQEIFGYISIPSADIEAPLYLGGSMTNLNKGATILGQTSMPIGGESTNCVIAGHRTWNGILHPFVGLEKVEVGDLVYLTNPWETLTYHVIETKIVLPDTVDEIMVQEGRDLLTIFTCTSPNTRRYMVICEREVEEGESKSWNWTLLPWVVSPLR
jgi:sortase A